MTARWPIGGHLGLSSPDQPMLAHLARSISPLDQIDALADHGFRGVQDLFLMLRPEAEQVAMADRMASRGLVLSSFSDLKYWNQPVWSAEDEAGLEHLRSSVDLSAEIAARFNGGSVVCVAGLDDQRPRDVQLRAMTENLKRYAEQAARSGLTLLVEPIAASRIPGLLLDQLEDAAEMVSAVAMPSVRLLFDTGHVAMMGHDVPSSFAACAQQTGLVQFADIPNRVDPGLGELDWPAILKAIEDHGYRGMIELEFEPANPTATGETQMLDRLKAFGIF
ncbi:sugar phosphate isomerase/epimerase family protein [Sphingobium agri]|uniref:Sugar phosphate isomerase/epimerase n=1 Tax=Sphingobium agri TaxID=2933566 RepID=A0ABT0DTR8_9SPHN|nr:sugar phosphate isomerase/epimerase family protein [Sphingobium agri]MCK0530507.1 sugar phosphate isomerase/epimerase [Sphingobium agri]